MKFELHWEDDALGVLADLWLTAHDKMEITKTQAEIDRRLTVSPFQFGTELSEGIYVIEVLPLRVLFEISESNRLVNVVAVKRIT